MIYVYKKILFQEFLFFYHCMAKVWPNGFEIICQVLGVMRENLPQLLQKKQSINTKC